MNLTPRLRLAEFSKAPQYTQYKFDDIFVFSSGKNIKQKEASPEFNTPCVRYGELYHMYGEVITETINRTNLGHSELTFSYGNEILLPSAGEDPLDIGSASALMLKDVAIGRTINVLRPKGDIEYSHVYVSYYINEKLRKRISKLARGASISNVYNTDLKTLKANLPELSEQQKIASFLSKVDAKIGLLSEKKDKLTEYKCGVMQQLFNGKWHEQDGQLTFAPPTLRFKADDGSEFPDWEKKRFSDCFEFFTTNSLSRDKLSYTSGEVKNIHYGDIHTKFRTVFLVTQENVPSIAEEIDTKKIKAQSYCQDGDLVFADASEDYADIGKCIEIRGLGNIKLVSGLHTHLARPKEKFALGYQAYLQKSWKMRYQIMRIAQGTKVLGISTKQLAQIDVPIPCYDEQEKIASFMISLDTKIEQLNSELNKTKEWKKGLLQQMFV